VAVYKIYLYANPVARKYRNFFYWIIAYYIKILAGWQKKWNAIWFSSLKWQQLGKSQKIAI